MQRSVSMRMEKYRRKRCLRKKGSFFMAKKSKLFRNDFISFVNRLCAFVDRMLRTGSKYLFVCSHFFYAINLIHHPFSDRFWELSTSVDGISNECRGVCAQYHYTKPHSWYYGNQEWWTPFLFCFVGCWSGWFNHGALFRTWRCYLKRSSNFTTTLSASNCSFSWGV